MPILIGLEPYFIVTKGNTLTAIPGQRALLKIVASNPKAIEALHT